MPKSRFVIRDIQGLTPAVDARQSENTTFVLSGRNYVLDSRGPRSAFASRLINLGVSLDASIDSANVQSEAGMIFTKERAGVFTRVSGSDWLFSPKFVYPQRIGTAFVWRRWTTAFIGNALYAAHPAVGLWKLAAGGAVQINPGIASPQAIVESNGRLIVLGSTAIAWSGPGSPEDFTPALGGSGFQVLSERVSGQPFMLTGIASGFITWTDGGTLVSEFVAGDLVFRHYIARHSHRPINDLAYIRMPDDSYLICTKQGLFSFNDTQEPSSATPVFNEFLRSILKDAPEAGLRVRLNHDRESDLIYLQIRNNSTFFNKTFVLAVAIDKWGTFDVSHQGIIQHGIPTEPVRSTVGYIDTRGRAHRFLPFGSDREVEPGVFTGLDSEVVLGPMRVPELQRYADVEQEMQSFYLSNHARPAWSYQSLLLVDDNVDFTQGGKLLDDGVELLTAPVDVVDESSVYATFPAVTSQVTVIADWSGFEPSGFVTSLEARRRTDVSMAIETAPSLIRDQATATHWGVLSPGIWHRIRVAATEPGEYFHITAGEFTFDYSGRLET